MGTGASACDRASCVLHRDRQRLLPRLQRAGFRADQLDVIRRGAAAAADDLHARPQHTARVLRHVLRRAEIDVAALHAHRQAGVGHGAHRLRGYRHHALDGFEGGLGTHRTIEADHVHRPRIHLAGEGLRIGAAGQVAEIVDGDLGDDRNRVADRVARGQHRFAQLVQVAEGLEDQHVHAGFHQRIHLLAEDGSRFGERGGAERLDAHAQRAHGAGHESRFARRFARQAHPGAVDILQLLGHPEGRQTHPVGAERVGLDDLRARLDVVLVDAAHQVRRRKVQLVEGTVEEHAAGVQHGAHRAIGDQHAARQLFAKLLGARSSGCHREGPGAARALGGPIAAFVIVAHSVKMKKFAARTSQRFRRPGVDPPGAC